MGNINVIVSISVPMNDRVKIIIEANRKGLPYGVYSVCCAQPLVIYAAIRQAIIDESTVLIEATANQVNQFGGYTGMQPKDFVDFVAAIAMELGYLQDNIFFGGDHLGPVCWVNEPAESAMLKAEGLIEAYVRAGFKKIHLDTSMPCADDPSELSDIIVAKRAAVLCAVAEKTAIECFGQSDLLYIVGTEVPPPGGATEEIESLEVTPVSRVQQTLEEHRKAFKEKELLSAWNRVIGLVVQPGVEFDHTSIIDYDSSKAQELSHFVTGVPNIVFEAHSTDYQNAQAYKELVNDHFAILKVGPQLTFAMREALFSLSYIEEELIPIKERSNLRAVCETEMLENNVYWNKFYQVLPSEATLYRRFSYSDRIRYYWNSNEITKTVDKLFSNLDKVTIPLPLISQFMPQEYLAIRKGSLQPKAKELVINKIMQVTDVYSAACYKQKPVEGK